MSKAKERVVPSVDEQVRAIMFGAEFGDPQLLEAMAGELRDRLTEAQKTNRPLRVYAGYDPSNPDLHLGHTITLRKLRQFQDFGHEVYFLVGTFTALVGDASDKLTGRPRKSAEEIRNAARTYADQCYLVLDRELTKVVYNGDWLSDLRLDHFVSLASNFTVQQFLVRDNFRRRIDQGDPIGLHELFYALLQGYDAVQLKADVQIGATEQLFNIQAGRKLQEINGQRPQVCITYPILVGTDGTMRMSKTARNYVGVAEPPEEQYGKVMSVSDRTMLEWIKFVTRWPPDKIEQLAADVQGGRLHAMELKKMLAWEIVSTYHADKAADAAQRNFEIVHQERELPEDIPEISVQAAVGILDLLAGLETVGSRSAARRLVQQHGVRINGDVIEDVKLLVQPGSLLQVGKRHFYRVVVSDK